MAISRTCVACSFLLLISVYFLQQLVQADNFAAVTVSGYAGGSSTSGLKIDCGGACAARCRLSSRPNLCKRACGTCCARCSCVPPGTYGNYDACPCYRQPHHSWQQAQVPLNMKKNLSVCAGQGRRASQCLW